MTGRIEDANKSRGTLSESPPVCPQQVSGFTSGRPSPSFRSGRRPSVPSRPACFLTARQDAQIQLPVARPSGASRREDGAPGVAERRPQRVARLRVGRGQGEASSGGPGERHTLPHHQRRLQRAARGRAPREAELAGGMCASRGSGLAEGAIARDRDAGKIEKRPRENREIERM